MSGDLDPARAASVLDVLGEDFWAWWRTGVCAGLVVLLLAWVLAASFDAYAHADLALLVKLLITGMLSAFMASVAYVSIKRLHRWRQVGTRRRLPVGRTAPRWDALGLLLVATLAWMALATLAGVSAVTTDLDGRATAPWAVAMLVTTAAAAAFGRWEKSLWTQALAIFLTLYFYLGISSVAQTVQGWTEAQTWAMTAASALVLGWSLRTTPVRLQANRSSTPSGWAHWAALELPLRAWIRARVMPRLRIVPVVAMGSSVMAAPFVADLNTGRWLWVWLTYQFMMLGFGALSWSATEQDWRQRLAPAFARQRHWLALRLWWGHCKWMIPTCVAFALLTSPWTLYWPRVPLSDAFSQVGPALPWLVANLALLLAGLTLWIGLRRERRHWDWLFVPAWVGTLAMGRWEGRSVLEVNAAWSGRLDLLGGMVVATLLLLASATWVWQRGSLTGMERWSLSGLLKPR